MRVAEIPVRRPVATAMAFVGLMVLGILSLVLVPVELLPPLEGDQLFVGFARAGSEPEVVERELLMPLQARATELAGVVEMTGEVSGASGTLSIRFAPGTDIGVRELELRRVAAELQREQPPGSFVEVSSFDLGAMSRFVMIVRAKGTSDENMLRELVDELVAPRLASVPGVARVIVSGGLPREITVRVDADRSAAAGVSPSAVSGALARAVARMRYVGRAEDDAGRTAVYVDGRPEGLVSLARTALVPGSPARLDDVATIDLGHSEPTSLYRVDGQPSVGLLVFKEEGANLVALGRALRERMTEVEADVSPLGVKLLVAVDGSELVEEQIDRLVSLGLSGFVIALVVLLAFMRQLRAVAVVGIAVPVSLVTAIAALYLFGHSINLLTLFGLAVGIGMLVDNSIVVYEAVQRQLERGASADAAAIEGVSRTLRAILAASVTNAVVFLPLVFLDIENATLRGLITVLVVAMLLPLAGSVIVAVGLVPLLARHLAAPAARARIDAERAQRLAFAGLRPPDRAREVFAGTLVAALRRPGLWLTASVVAVVVTAVLAVPLLIGSTAGQEAAEVREVRQDVTLRGGQSLDRALEVIERLEAVAMEYPGVETVEAVIEEDGGFINARFVDLEERPEGSEPATLRRLLREEAASFAGVALETSEGMGGGGGGGGGDPMAQALGQGAAEIVLSGPDNARLAELAREVAQRVAAIDGVAFAEPVQGVASRELRVLPDELALASLGLTADVVLPVLSVVRREGVELRVGMTMPDGDEIPLVVRRTEDIPGARALARLPVAIEGGGIQPLGALVDLQRVPPPPVIRHQDGRRETRVSYLFDTSAPSSGNARAALEARVVDAVRGVHRPPGYTIETPSADESTKWFRAAVVPALLLLFAVLAVTFESLTMPILVLFSIPLTLIGGAWALVISGHGAAPMALVGALALMGLTVNPAILLVDRMQSRLRAGFAGAGGAALAAVRERARPVLMTTTTTLAGLWPLAIATGRENELWPPFAVVVMGGLVTSTVLTLVVIPLGFVLFARLDALFGRLGPWVVIGCAGSTTGVIAPLVMTGVLESLTWQIVTTVLVASAVVGAVALGWKRPPLPDPLAAGSPPRLEVRFLHKTYGEPGPVGHAWRAPEIFARRVRERGGKPAAPWQARARLLPWALVIAGTLYFAFSLSSLFWRTFHILLGAFFAGRFVVDLEQARGRDEPGTLARAAAIGAPWIAFAVTLWRISEGGEEWTFLRVTFLVLLFGVIALSQLGRHTARRVALGSLPAVSGWRARWRSFASAVFGFDLPSEAVRALRGVEFSAERGMIGILGPNGAGKTSVLRTLAGILDPSRGVVRIGGVPLKEIRHVLGRFVGYLPQDFGLPEGMTAREYLLYWALLYEVRPAEERERRVARLLEEVGLEGRADERIGGFSGGMKQRVAVARTLLRLPPVIIVDEPTVGLDPRERIRFRNLLARLAEGRIVLFSTHVVEDVAVACERVLVVTQGRVVFDGTPAGLAATAAGRVYIVRVALGEAITLPPGAHVVDQAPDAEGGALWRVLSDAPPAPCAIAAEPSLEDAFLMLTGHSVKVAG